MDDVLVDFVNGVHKTLNTPIHKRSINLSGLNHKEIIPTVNNWWENLEPRDDAYLLFEYVKSYDPYILTAYADWDKRSIKAKYSWMHRHFS
ncbi:MAG: hypothetical protein WD512_11545, partial [Candidatus Paceibacterota bacterium]